MTKPRKPTPRAPAKRRKVDLSVRQFDCDDTVGHRCDGRAWVTRSCGNDGEFIVVGAGQQNGWSGWAVHLRPASARRLAKALLKLAGGES